MLELFSVETTSSPHLFSSIEKLVLATLVLSTISLLLYEEKHFHAALSDAEVHPLIEPHDLKLQFRHLCRFSHDLHSQISYITC